ncbi:MAG TPA: M24 family metallopeptidase [Gemmataceae bacterium]
MVVGENSGAGLGLDLAPPPDSPRRADVEAKQAWVVELLERVGAEFLLVLDPPNFHWLTSGAMARGLRAPEEHPAVLVNSAQRWLVCSNADTRYFFDEELDQMGFQLKEWPWHGSRQALVAELCETRRVVCDVSLGSYPSVGDELRQQRLCLNEYERQRYLMLGRALAHAVEATARNLAPGQSEEEVAGQLGHRLLHHGIEPAALQVVADARGKDYRRGGYGREPVRRCCTLFAAGGWEGLYAAAGRVVCFGEPGREFRDAYETAARLSAALFGGSRPGVSVAALFDAFRKLTEDTPYEHEWRLGPVGYRTGRAPVEELLLPRQEERFRPGEALLWQTWVGGALVCDTVLVGEEGPVPVTSTDEWAVRRYRFPKGVVERPDLLVRTPEGEGGPQ